MKKRNTETKIKELNDMYAKYIRACESAAEEYRRAMGGKGRSPKGFYAAKLYADGLSRQFDEMRGAMGTLKFDMARGEYFCAEDGDREVFAIRVRRTDTFDLRVAAGSAKEAIDVAKTQVARENGIPLDCLEAEDSSR